MKKLLFAVLATTAMFTACKKDDNSTPSRKDMLVNGRWQLTASTTNSKFATSTSTVFDSTEDNLASYYPCEKDNLDIFNSDGTVTEDEGSTKCASTSPQTTVIGTWSLSNNDSKFILTPSANQNDTTTISGDIIELTSTTFHFRSTNVRTVNPYTLTTVDDYTFTNRK
jgi:hypothetical protein